MTPAAAGSKIRAWSKELTMTSINDIADLVQILQDHPGWRDTVRAMIVGEELGKLPEEMTAFVRATNENFTLVHQQFEKVDQRLERLEKDVGTLREDVSTLKEDVGTLNKTVSKMGGDVRRLTGNEYESHVSRYVHRHLRRNLSINAIVFSTQRDGSALTELLDKAEKQGIILAQETDELDEADLVLTADAPTDYILAEVSITIQQDDIDRAARRAGLLAKATGRTVVPFAIGAREETDLRKEHVQVLLIPEPQPPRNTDEK